MCLLGNAKENVTLQTPIFQETTNIHSYRVFNQKVHQKCNVRAQSNQATGLFWQICSHSNTWDRHTKNTQTVTLLLLGCTPYLWPVEHILYRQHGDYCQHFLTASQMYRHDQHLTQHRLQGEFCHLQETCFRVPCDILEKSWILSVQKRAMPFLPCFLSTAVGFTQNNFAQHETNYLSIFTTTRISQYLQEIFRHW